jgi:hypothetical protein
MRTLFSNWTLLAILAIAVQTVGVSTVSAGNLLTLDDGDQTEEVIGHDGLKVRNVSFLDKDAAEPCGSEYGSCDVGCSGGKSGDLCLAYADPCPKVGLYASLGIESWRGVSDGLTNNNGAVTSLNMGIPLPKLSEWGFGWQLGGSFGIYDWMGRATNGTANANQAQTQEFITTGIFRRADECSPWSGGVVYDMMANSNFGTLAQDPYLGQWRAQVGYALSGKNEIGVWAAWREHSSIREYFTPNLPITYQPIGQFNAYWHHKFCENGADSWLWMGFPSQTRLNTAFGGALLDLTFGAAVQTPLTDNLALSANFQYAKAASTPGVLGSLEDAFDVSVALVYYPGSARSRTVAGRSWIPLLPVANNGSFLVDRNM